MENSHDKICDSYQTVVNYATKLRDSGARIVLTQGSFDMLHIGHGRYLEEAKSAGDILIVGVDSDEKITARKGPDRPVVPQEERVEMLSYLSSVDCVVVKDLDQTKWALIKALRPDVLVATKETYSKDQLAQLLEWCGEVKVLEPMATTSTSAKIRLVQVGAAKRMSKTLSKRLVAAIEGILEELKAELDQ